MRSRRALRTIRRVTITTVPPNGRSVRENRTDYRLLRRALLRDLSTGARSRGEVCDAHPELVRAGLHIGVPRRETCPVCEADTLRAVHYAFPSRGPHRRSGRALPQGVLARHAERHGDLMVYVVEVCTGCAWHHLLESYRLLARGSAVG